MQEDAMPQTTFKSLTDATKLTILAAATIVLIVAVLALMAR
jgi:hypothetical protein